MSPVLLVVVTPVSKKQSPPKERPTDWTFWTASVNASVTAGFARYWPFQSDHMPGSDMLADHFRPLISGEQLQELRVGPPEFGVEPAGGDPPLDPDADLER